MVESRAPLEGTSFFKWQPVRVCTLLDTCVHVVVLTASLHNRLRKCALCKPLRSLPTQNPASMSVSKSVSILRSMPGPRRRASAIRNRYRRFQKPSRNSGNTLTAAGGRVPARCRCFRPCRAHDRDETRVRTPLGEVSLRSYPVAQTIARRTRGS